jgi:hypothetical protein
MQIPIPPTPERLLGSAVGTGLSKANELLFAGVRKLGAPDLDAIERQMAELRSQDEARQQR